MPSRRPPSWPSTRWMPHEREREAMYLKSIALKGFKSFPDRTRLDFGPGVSVIVGPNGSGKSNVTDAVLWALGEQSPLAVRGQSMQDVIFGGAPGRQAARSAEVELVLDDSEGALGLGAPEVSIVRRLDRSGEGEYRLAGARCRLVDVIEVLSDTGLGKEMHSVISQGRVESLVTSEPRERRLLIEEAAGLGKHRKRRRRAQLKLGRTQDNLDRALDVEREARSRLRPLKRQAEADELHARLERQALEIRWDLSRDDVRSYRGAMAAAETRATEVRTRRRELEDQLEAVAKRREAAEEALAARGAPTRRAGRRSASDTALTPSVPPRHHSRIGWLATAISWAPWRPRLPPTRTTRRRRGASPVWRSHWRPSTETARPSSHASSPSSRASWLPPPGGWPSSLRPWPPHSGSARWPKRQPRTFAATCGRPSARWRRPAARRRASAASWPPPTSSCVTTLARRTAPRRSPMNSTWNPVTSWPWQPR